MNTLVVFETFQIKGRGTAYIVEAGDPPFMGGEEVLLDGVRHVVTGVEMQPMATPRYVFDGKQMLLLRRATCAGPGCDQAPLDAGAWCAVHAIIWGSPVYPDYLMLAFGSTDV